MGQSKSTVNLKEPKNVTLTDLTRSPSRESTPMASKTQNKSKAEFSRLFHEIEFRAIKNALMNYHEAEKLENKGTVYKYTTNVLTAMSASGVLAALVQSGKVLANKFGVAGLIGLPVSGIAQLMGENTSSLIPSYNERAKKHTIAAAGWKSVAETARMERRRIQVDPNLDVARLVEVYKALIEKKEEVSKKVLIPKDTHRLFSQNPENVYFAMKKRNTAFEEFLQIEKQNQSSKDDLEDADDLYF